MNPAEPTSNLCAQIPTSLLARIREEQEKAGLPRGEYITHILTAYYENQYEKGEKTMESKTLAFQIPAELFDRIKDHLDREKKRPGKRLTQRDFVIGLIEQALAESEQQAAKEPGEETEPDIESAQE